MKKTILLVVLFSIFTSTFAQVPPKVNLISVGLTSPEAASLGKFGNIPVGYSTGVPQISIPVFEINLPGIKLPVSLDYHASGIRVDEISSSVGIGWTLNAGGVISRAMIGYPDESGPGYLNAPPTDKLLNNRTNYVDFIYDNTNGLNDINPDVFSYNFGSETGKFMIKKSDRSFIQFPLSDNRIENYPGSSYRITDKNGVCYIFEQKETTQLGPVNQVQLIPTYTSAWRLTKIVSSNVKDTVFITYDLVQNLLQLNKSYSHTIGTVATCTSNPNDPSNGPSDPTPINSDSYSSQSITGSETYVKEITWRGGKISFSNIADRTDRLQAKRLDEIDVYCKVNNIFKLIKKAKLIHSYFYYLPSNYTVPQEVGSESLYRLKLDSVKFYDVKNILSPQTYNMTYDNTPMAPRYSAGQDAFGFNNGHFENRTLMTKQTVLFNPLGVASSYYTFGDANRDCDPAFVTACSIQSITYPTGGKTVFELEPHQYATNINKTISNTIEARATGGIQTSVTASFNLTNAMINLRYKGYISSYNYPNVTDRPRLTMTDQGTGEQVIIVNNMNPSQNVLTGDVPLNYANLQVGHTYILKADIYTTNSNVSAYLDVTYDQETTEQLVLNGGGLRIKNLTNYDINNNFIARKSYVYGNNGQGTLLTPYNYLTNFSQITTSRKGCGANAGCQYAFGKPSITYYANTTTPVSQYSGSPVIYGAVTEYEVSGDGSYLNGKKVFSYTVYQDQQVLAYNDYSVVGFQMVSNVWRNGYLRQEDTYKKDGSSAFKLINSKVHNYVFSRLNTEPMVRFKPKYAEVLDGTSCYQHNASSLGNDVFIDGYSIPYSAVLLQSDSETSFEDNGSPVESVKNFSYEDATHLSPTKIETINSRGDSMTEVMQYPNNFASMGNVYTRMLIRNIISPVISRQQLVKGSQTYLVKTNYGDWFSDGTLLMPQTIEQQIGGNLNVTLVNFMQFDMFGNILEQARTGGPSQAYRWGYYSQYPIAEVKNAAVKDTWYDGFEEGTGNSNVEDAKTGHYSKTDGYNKNINSLTNGIYRLTYWKKSGNAWVYNSVENISITGGSYSINLSGQVDDVCFYPANALMTTFTYDPGYGMTSQTDVKGMTTFYEYDGFQRLINARDQNRYIIKHIDYNYQLH